jgi:hypothetical protein
MMNKYQLQLSTLRIGILILSLLTALIHIYLAFQFPNGTDIIFVLNGLGYLGLAALLYLPLPSMQRYRPLVRWMLIGYTALTVILWVLIGARNAIAYFDKLIELGLMALLWMEQQEAS